MSAAGAEPRWSARRATMALCTATAALTALRAYAATTVGFGDSEALYAAYANHPQPMFLDHPGTVGLLMGALGGGRAPSPATAHAATTVAAALLPWLVVGAARALGAPWVRAASAGLLFAVVPEIAVGTFALTPDLPLAFAWLASLACAGLGLRRPADDSLGAAALVASGTLAGVATASKVSGALLVMALAATYLAPSARAHARAPWPWAGLAIALVPIVPLALFEHRSGYPMWTHRLLTTQRDAGVSLRNLGALLGGQLAYLSPVVAWVALRATRAMWRGGDDDDHVTALLVRATLVPLVALTALALWSRVAEPHWLAPAWLSLLLFVAVRGAPASERTIVTATATAAAVSLAVHAWVLVPSSHRLLPPTADLRLDIASELYGWPEVAAEVRAQLSPAPLAPFAEEAVVVGPHWTVCAQLDAALSPVRVGCATPVRDDFDRWLPRDEWKRRDRVVFVRDNRFADDGAAHLPAHAVASRSPVTVRRGGRVARELEVIVYESRARADVTRSEPPTAAAPSSPAPRPR